MSEHFRDFRDPQADRHADAILDPPDDAAHRFLTRHGVSILEGLGAEERTGGDGQRWMFKTSQHEAVIDIHKPDIVIPAILRHGTIGLFYTYTADDQPLWTPNGDLTVVPEDVDTGNPTPDSLVTLCEALYEASAGIRQLGYMGARVLEPIRDRMALGKWSMSTDQTKAEIATHYDLSPAVYTGEHGFLDDKYVQYSSGLLAPGSKFESLEDLQREKVDSLARQLELDTAETLLEVGGGWGGLAIALALKHPNLHITSLTVSDEQLKIARQRAEDAGVADRVTFLGKDYRDLEVDKPFDRVVSVEMIEAVDWRDHGVYFDALKDFVDPENGVIVLQSINIPKERFAHQKGNKSFANTAIFPGGVLTPKEVISQEMAKRGWRTHQETELGPSYALTLREWVRNLYDAKPALTKQWMAEGIPLEKIERFYRGFSTYLAFCEAGFRPATNNIQGSQQTFRPK